MRGFRMPAKLEAKLDAWIDAQPEPKPSRSDAIRRLLERALQDSQVECPLSPVGAFSSRQG